MKKARFALWALCLALLVPLLVHAWRVLPLDNRPLVAEKYAGWSGVLRLWVFEGWSSGSGSLTAWLNGCIARFEKRHPGVYIQPRSVDAGAIADFAGSGILPPDLMLFPPGLLDGPEGLMPLAASANLRPALAGCGTWNGTTYAVPVAMGGYLWAWNAALTDGVPADWREADAVLAVPEPEPWRRWDAALLALCAGRRAEAAQSGEDAAVLPGIDLGLGERDTPAPNATPAPEGAPMPCQLPEDFAFDAEAWRRFSNGEAAAMPVTQREIRRLQALSEQGRGPDWRLAPGSAAFTDQLLCLAVVDKPDAGAQRALCAELAAWLLEDECQSALAQAGAFSVTGAPSGYPAGDPLAEMDAALRDAGLVVPNCFDGSWPETAERIVRDFVSGSGESPALWRALTARMQRNPNIPE